ncbi:xyloglucan endotransglucosylase/hydrolase protein 3-like [Primulina huaijiensis]|uniref:xyloglucan endotransglucosylase/hydrolase protein 3-like n=1 Tax=Primulina huaijiensis TaxID=1492673 RepID=UPI003CC75482
MDFIIILTIILGVLPMKSNGANNSFNHYYTYLWGNDHFWVNPQGNEVQLKLDKSSGAGFRSKSDFGSGSFHIKLKIPNKKTRGIITSFYLTSVPDDGKPAGNHFELDFEFWGVDNMLQTNVFDNDGGNREQRFHLWFDPSKDFHSYQIIWNSHQIVFTVDNIPIRVLKNNVAKGVAFPNKSMHVEASVWNASFAGPVTWSQAPFVAHYQDFSLDACSAPAGSEDISPCLSQQYFWNKPEYWVLSASQRQQMDRYRKSYMYYDYCSSKTTRKPECSLN